MVSSPVRSPPALTVWIVAAMAAGAALGFAAPEFALRLTPVTNIFLRLIRSAIAPVLFGALVSAARAAAPRELGRLAGKAVIYFEVVTALALLIGWTAVSLTQPGASLRLGSAGGTQQAVIPGAAELIAAAFPVSVIDAMARGDILQIVLFTSIFAAACAAAGAAAARPVLDFAESLAAIAFQYTRFVMALAPLAVCASVATTIAGNGSVALAGLARFVATAWAAQLFFVVTVLWLSLRLGGVGVRAFAAAVKEPVLVGFATTSSAAALPQTLESQDRLRVPRAVSGIVTPLSLTLNMTGSSIHLAMGALFAAQAAGMTLTWTQQAAILATLKLTCKGVAGIPRANLVILGGLFTMFGLPAEALPVLLGVDALIDPLRTSVNVMGHAAAAPVVARWAATSDPSAAPRPTG